MSDTCKATIDLDDGRTLACTLPARHRGPVHETADGEAWGGDLAWTAPRERDMTPGGDDVSP